MEENKKSDKMDAARYVCATALVVLYTNEVKAVTRQELSSFSFRLSYQEKRQDESPTQHLFTVCSRDKALLRRYYDRSKGENQVMLVTTQDRGRSGWMGQQNI